MIFETAKQLGEELHNSEAYQKFLQAQDALTADRQAYATLNEIQSLEQEIAALMEQPDADQNEVKNKLQLFRDLCDRAAATPVIAAYQEASQEFDAIMEQVNNIIQFQVTGTIPEESSCTGNCSTCGGSCGHHH